MNVRVRFTPRRARLRLFGLASVLALLFGACRSTLPVQADWITATLPAASERVLWQVTSLAFQKARMPVLSGFDPTTRTAESGWRTDLSPFRGRGYRERARVRYTPSDEPGRIDLSVRVLRESNMDIAKPLDITYADWKPAPDDGPKARILLQYIQSLLGQEIEVGKR